MWTTLSGESSGIVRLNVWALDSYFVFRQCILWTSVCVLQSLLEIKSTLSHLCYPFVKSSTSNIFVAIIAFIRWKAVVKPKCFGEMVGLSKHSLLSLFSYCCVFCLVPVQQLVFIICTSMHYLHSLTVCVLCLLWIVMHLFPFSCCKYSHLCVQW